MRFTSLAVPIVGLAVLGLANPAPAQELGPEFTVAPADAEYVLAADEGGGFIVAWTAETNGAKRLLVRRYASSGIALGAVTLLGRAHDGETEFLAATAVGKGSYVVAWSRLTHGSERILARRIGPSDAGRLKDLGAAPVGFGTGVALAGVGGEEWASLVAYPRPGAAFGFGGIWLTPRSESGAARRAVRVTPSGFAPAMASGVAGTLLIAYRTARPGAPETIRCQLRDGDGRSLASSRVTSTEFDISSIPLLAANGSGRFVVGWVERQTLWLRVFEPLMSAIGEPLETGSEASSAALAMDPAGSVLAAFSLASEFVESPIQGRRVDRQGTPTGEQFQIAIGNGPPAAAALGRGRFVVVWHQGDALRARIIRW